MRHLGGSFGEGVVGTEVEQFVYFYLHPVYYFNKIIIAPRFFRPTSLFKKAARYGLIVDKRLIIILIKDRCQTAKNANPYPTPPTPTPVSATKDPQPKPQSFCSKTTQNIYNPSKDENKTFAHA